MGSYASRRERKKGSDLWQYLLITALAVIGLFLIVNFVLPMIGDAEENRDADSNNIIIDINVEDDELNNSEN